MLFEDLKYNYPDFELVTGLCNQDSLEHLFSKLRQRGGHCEYPNARMVRLALQHIISTGNIEEEQNSNVQLQNKNSYMLISEPSEVEKQFHNSDNYLTNSVDEFDDEDQQEILDKVDNFNDTEEEIMFTGKFFYEVNAVSFYAGYIASKCVSKSKCERRKSMVQTYLF